jgi:hypothetical protein
LRYSRRYGRRGRRKLRTKGRIDGKIKGRGLKEILRHIDKKNKNKIEENRGYMEMKSKKWENMGEE